MTTRNFLLLDAPLGKKTKYRSNYEPQLLFPIPRQDKRSEIGIMKSLPFQGGEFWNAYEFSWLSTRGKPIVARAEFFIPCDSPFLIESKSFKLYVNSFSQTKFEDEIAVAKVLKKDLSAKSGATVEVNIFPLTQKEKLHTHFKGICIDHFDIHCDTYLPEPKYLKTENEIVTETLYSDLLKSNCLITGQPDWASIQIKYTGKKINHENLLRYLVSFRNHEEFHEQCVERMFMDIMQHCQPKKLFVYARYTRRGGLDINPYRANYPTKVKNARLVRQ